MLTAAHSSACSSHCPSLAAGVTLIGAPSASVPLVQAAAMPTLDDPRQRARYAWEAFLAAMRGDLTTDADGWCILGAAERTTPLPRPWPNTGSFLRVGAIHYAYEARTDPARPFIYEKHRDLDLTGGTKAWV